MSSALVIHLIASLGLCSGLACLYLRWREPRRRGRGWLVAGWGLVLFGLAGWCLSGHGDVALSDAVTLAMVAALGLIAGHAVTLAPAARTPRARASSDNDGLVLGRGYWGRVVARLLGSVVAAPVAGLMAGALWYARVPGDPADRLMMMAVIAVAGMAIAVVVQLASTRPWRSLAIIGVIACTAAVLAFLPVGGHA
jgi:hypothetical protein